MKAILQGTPEVESSPEQVYQLVHGIVDEQVLRLLPQVLHVLPFESRKDAQVIFSFVFRYRQPSNYPVPSDPQNQQPPPIAVEFVTNHAPSVLVALCHGYDHKESATTAGSILREVLKHEAAAAVVLYDDGDEDPNSGSSFGGAAKINVNRVQSGRGVFWKFFEWIDTSSFEVAADAFNTFRVRFFLSFLFIFLFLALFLFLASLVKLSLPLSLRLLLFADSNSSPPFRNSSLGTRSLCRGTSASTSTSSSNTTTRSSSSPTATSPSASLSSCSARCCSTAPTTPS